MAAYKPIDFSRFDHLEDSDDEDDAPVRTREAPSGLLESLMPGRSAGQGRSGRNRQRASSRIKVHPRDFSAPDFVYTDPEAFKPTLYEGCKYLMTWGVYGEDESGLEIMQRQMTTQTLYEHQFVGLLIDCKQRLLRKNLPNVEHLFKQDMVLDIELEIIVPRTWRRVRVSGGITLSTLHDKVMAPLMGWVRNYHAWQMYDHTDGATWGALDSNAIDMMHMSMNGFKTMDGARTKLAEILQIPGATMGYMYDLGDHWAHVITLVEVVPAEESTGRCLVLDGSMACPPEDSNGLDGMGIQPYQKFLHKVLAAKAGTSGSDRRRYRELCASASGGLNYNDRVYDPHAFSVADTQEAVKAAFRSKASVPQGSKQFTVPLMSGYSDPFPAPPGARTQNSPSPSGLSRGFMTEAVATRRDKGNNTGCAECGKPNDLMLCSGCRDVRFCSRDCQRTAWRAWHKQECLSAQAAKARSARG